MEILQVNEKEKKCWNHLIEANPIKPLIGCVSENVEMDGENNDLDWDTESAGNNLVNLVWPHAM